MDKIAPPSINTSGFNINNAKIYDDESMLSPGSRIKRNRPGKEQLNILYSCFGVNPYPSREEIRFISAMTNLDFAKTRNWFQNQRSKIRRRSECSRTASDSGVSTPSLNSPCSENFTDNLDWDSFLNPINEESSNIGSPDFYTISNISAQSFLPELKISLADNDECSEVPKKATAPTSPLSPFSSTKPKVMDARKIDKLPHATIQSIHWDMISDIEEAIAGAHNL